METVCFRKSRRAQNKSDYETWVRSDVSNTINLFDGGGDARATTVIVFDMLNLNPKMDEKCQTLNAYNGTGGNNMPLILRINERTDSFGIKSESRNDNG